MSWRETLGKLDRVQQSLGFKVAASIVVVALAIGAIVYYAVESARKANEQEQRLVDRFGRPGDAKVETKEEKEKAEASTDPQVLMERMAREQRETTARILRDLSTRNVSVGHVAVGAGVVGAVLLAVIWLGLALTYLGITLIAGLLFGLIKLGEVAQIPGAQTLANLWPMALGGLALAASFAALMQALRMALSAPHPVFAVARNVLAEAVRLKISLVFIVLLVLVLAALPLLLDPGTPLRYRVQAFLQYSIAASSTIIAILALFLGAASVAFEQRDKIIWQTMTKPVRAWHYVLGKWLGVVSLSAVLLGVSACGIFLFTEYLRRQPASGEASAYVPQDPRIPITEDRLILEYQVLVGRVSARPYKPKELQQTIDKALEQRLEQAIKERETDPGAPAPDVAKLRKEVEGEVATAFFSIGSGVPRVFEFRDIAAARDSGLPITLRYKFNAGTSSPTDFYNITLLIPNWAPLVRNVPVGQMMTELIPASAVSEIPVPITDSSGKPTGEVERVLMLPIGFVNADVNREIANPETMTFPPDGMEISYPASSFASNFLRVAMVIWLKIAFLSGVAITAATFLSFPVACMTAFGTFLVAESSGFLNRSLEYYGVVDEATKSVQWDRAIIKPFARLLSDMFGFYADLNPTAALVEGKLINADTVVQSGVIFLIVTAGLLAIGAFIFQRRELATYSGQ